MAHVVDREEGVSHLEDRRRPLQLTGPAPGLAKFPLELARPREHAHAIGPDVGQDERATRRLHPHGHRARKEVGAVLVQGHRVQQSEPGTGIRGVPRGGLPGASRQDGAHEQEGPCAPLHGEPATRHHGQQWQLAQHAVQQ